MSRRKIPRAVFDSSQLTEIVTAGEAAAYLGISKPTLIKYVALGEIPGRKLGRQWRFMREDLRAYVSGGPGKEDEA
ncbi:MAG: helix-turn-helix domain-containing protein [Ruminococcaceae bacterium]|nr:helix-turn-helix domain-containing protein [Oscillospiraceae bacterium]